jgi:hypothetical protein
MHGERGLDVARGPAHSQRRLRPAAPTHFGEGLHERREAIFGGPFCYGNPRIASFTFSRLHASRCRLRGKTLSRFRYLARPLDASK